MIAVIAALQTCMCAPQSTRTTTTRYNAGVNTIAAMKIVGHTDYRTTANICTLPDEETLIKSGMSPDAVFEKKNRKANRMDAKNNANAQIFSIGK